MLPELQKFRTHLESQGIQIENRVERRNDQDYLRAQLLIEYPPPSVSVLDICYHYSDECLIISSQIGEKTSDDAYKFSLADLNEVTKVEAYEMIESFVTFVFNEFSLCEFVTEENEDL